MPTRLFLSFADARRLSGSEGMQASPMQAPVNNAARLRYRNVWE